MDQLIKDEMYKLLKKQLSRVKADIESLESTIDENESGESMDWNAFIQLSNDSKELSDNTLHVQHTIEVLNKLI